MKSRVFTVKWFNDLQIEHNVIVLCQTLFLRHSYHSDRLGCVSISANWLNV